MGEQKNQKTQDVNQLLKIRRDKLAELQADGKDPFQITKFDVTHHSQEVKDQFEDLEGKSVVLAGRMMSKRVMGKASFCNIQDLQGNIQSYVARDSIGEEEYKAFKKMDIGDIVGLEGEVFKTKTGRNFHSCIQGNSAFQESSDSSGKISWSDQYRHPLSSALCRSDHERRRKRNLYQTFQDHQCSTSVSERTGIPGS